MAENAQDPKQLFKEFAQIGAVVADLDQAIKVLSELFGLGPWRTFPQWPPPERADMERYYHGERSDFTARMAFVDIGPVELELIQPVSGDSIWADFLREHGPGLHHLRFNIDDLEPFRQFAAEHGLSITQWGHGLRPGTAWANLNTEALIGFTIEVMRKVPGSSWRAPGIVDGTLEG